MDSYVIAIAGGTGAGKTTIAREITEGLDVRLLGMDNYYKPHDNISMEERDNLNFDHPDIYDWDLFLEHLIELKSGRRIEMPIYDFSKHNRIKTTIPIIPSKVIVIEGILALVKPEVNKEYDLKIFVDTDHDLRIIRRLQRDIKERGRTHEGVIKQYLDSVKPMHKEYVERSMESANIIVRGDESPEEVTKTINGLRHIIRGAYFTRNRDY